MIRPINASLAQRLDKKSVLEENTEYEKLIQEYVKTVYYDVLNFTLVMFIHFVLIKIKE